ncbi:DUF5606 family protein [Flavilitoribacter nigricans]|uniref:Uncharacterized protein n=1 Tax=Flavilitoribacter nigricans (strain ATCC 23147 / DSM 23189 / NBRC 102662 / NCIMB 1420 / SS-2) TaxID=1122177 RepID=A0A2D0MXF0_FLAN2|nr:DUF5606 domain-containing protein [Flavilitoribacter nigricans]PHN00952.1 hypothetical protein CRP01_39630 [Flavilitoribacter nigricans DSM 23189 = NBRC 102662]
MKIENIMAVSGLPGLYRMAANRNNGLIIEDLSTGKKRFASSRKHQFTPLESIGIYTDDGDTAELRVVFRNMLDQLEDNPPVDTGAPTEELTEYFADILPNYDRDRVKVGDIKKVIKWFSFLQEQELLQDDDAASPTEVKDEEE